MLGPQLIIHNYCSNNLGCLYMFTQCFFCFFFNLKEDPLWVLRLKLYNEIIYCHYRSVISASDFIKTESECLFSVLLDLLKQRVVESKSWLSQCRLKRRLLAVDLLSSFSSFL